jgi:transposase
LTLDYKRWLLIESEQRRKSDLERLTKKIEQYQQKSQQEMNGLSTQEFACIEDAISAAQKLSPKMIWHELSDIQTVEKRHYSRAGKPSKDNPPKRISYRVTGIVIPIKSEISAQNIRCGRFILATNVLDREQLSADQALHEYKAQQGVERGFRFLKDPLFFASSIFLKSPKRVAALGMIMSLCLLV